MLNENNSYIKNEIRKFFRYNKNLTLKDVIEGFADWIAFTTLVSQDSLSFFFDKYLQSFLFYSIKEIREKDKC